MENIISAFESAGIVRTYNKTSINVSYTYTYTKLLIVTKEDG